MKIKDLNYYVKFIFSANDGGCISTTDVEMFEFVKYKNTDESVNSLKVGDEIYFIPNTEKQYKVTDVIVRHIVSDTDALKYGIDSEDCTEHQGEYKEWLLSILVRIDVIKK